MYAIIDLETTGTSAGSDRITEIAIVLHDGKTIVDSYSTLVNPEILIPYYIIEMTGISNEMVQEAPKFYEVAKKVIDLTEGKIFVAHNVRFDYSFLKAEFSALGYTYSRKTLCTVRLSRKMIPGLPSYSLGKLCESINIPIKNRHRALGDAEATAILFDRILNIQDTPLNPESLIKEEIKSQTLPPHLNKEIFLNLPEQPGIYYFHDETGNILYVGKSINIKKRISQHFGIDFKSSKSLHFKNLIHDISFELTGNELVALLFESEEIKRLKPKYNTALKRYFQSFYCIYPQLDEEGYQNLVIEKINKKSEPLILFDSLRQAQNFLQLKILKFSLCEHKSLKNRKGACFNFHLKKCVGACINLEEPESYNQRVNDAISSFSFKNESFFIIGKGRDQEEKSVVFIERGIYKGFGFYNQCESLSDPSQLKSFVKNYTHNRDIQNIICGYLKKNKSDKIIKLQE